MELKFKKIDNTPVALEEKAVKDALKLISGIIGSLDFFKAQIKNNELVQSDIETHLFLAEHYLADLAKAVGYDSVLAKEVEERYREIREKNTEIMRLEGLLGSGVSAESVTSAMRKYEDVFHAWYKSEGFHYASIEFNTRGIVADFSHQMNDKDDSLSEYHLESGSSIEEKISSGWDIIKMRYHAELVDTDNNKAKFTDLLLSAFPKSRIHSFSSWRGDSERFCLRPKVIVDFTDIEAFARRHNIG